MKLNRLEWLILKLGQLFSYSKFLLTLLFNPLKFKNAASFNLKRETISFGCFRCIFYFSWQILTLFLLKHIFYIIIASLRLGKFTVFRCVSRFQLFCQLFLWLILINLFCNLFLCRGGDTWWCCAWNRPLFLDFCF